MLMKLSGGEKLLTNERTIILAYDQGLEHGPTDFDLGNVDPAGVIGLAEKAKLNGLVLQHGIAEKYYDAKKHTVPLIVKLNGKTSLFKGEACSYQVCSLERAIRLGATAVGYTLYPGSEYESLMFREFAHIVESAHKLGVPVLAWVYPRGAGVDENSTATIAYAARVGLELGADFAKIKYNGDMEGFKWAVKAAGKCRVVLSGGPKVDDIGFLSITREVLDAGAVGIAVGRNVWQHKTPDKMLAALKEVVFKHKLPHQAAKKL
jgi:fructose-bisphosphate aldolase, class I